jgi:hypothetical protein
MERTPRYAFTSLGQAALLVLQNLEPRELRVGVEEQDDHDETDHDPVAVHVVAPVELTPAPDCAALVAPADGWSTVVGGQAFVGIVVIRRPLKLRIWRW